jgi:hypothetical protein
MAVYIVLCLFIIITLLLRLNDKLVAKVLYILKYKFSEKHLIYVITLIKWHYVGNYHGFINRKVGKFKAIKRYYGIFNVESIC